MGVSGPTFPSTPFLSIDAVGSEIWTALHEHINCGTHQRVPNRSSIDLLNAVTRHREEEVAGRSEVRDDVFGNDLPIDAIPLNRRRWL